MSSVSLPPPPPDALQSNAPPRPARRWPWVLGLLAALCLGGAIGYGGTPEPEIVTKEVTVEIEVEPADMDERRAVLDQRQEELDDEAAELEQRGTDLDDP